MPCSLGIKGFNFVCLFQMLVKSSDLPLSWIQLRQLSYIIEYNFLVINMLKITPFSSKVKQFSYFPKAKGTLKHLLFANNHVPHLLQKSYTVSYAQSGVPTSEPMSKDSWH